MGTAYQPKIITDGLAFIYDTGSGKSYKGEPTTNVNTLTLSDSGTDGSGQSSVGTRTVITDNHVRIVDVSSNTRQSHLITGLTASTTYTISIMYKKLDGTPTFRFQIQDYSGAAYLRTIKFTNTTEIGIEDREGWQQASWTFTLGSDANAVRIWYQDGADYTTYTHSFELQNPQLEAKSHATPYVDGTRSATQGLLDLTNTATIDISNASFDSNAQMTFDGTDDYITAGNPTELQFIYSDPFSLEVWIKADDLSGFNHVIGKTYGNYRLSVTSSGYSFRLDSNNITTNAGNPVVGEWQHVVTTWEPSTSTARVYVNGVLEQSVTDATVDWTYTSANFQLGNSPGENYHFNGTIPAARVYSKTVTAAEVLQNFNASRDRFKI
jgi:hypothetical protein